VEASVLSGVYLISIFNHFYKIDPFTISHQSYGLDFSRTSPPLMPRSGLFSVYCITPRSLHPQTAMWPPNPTRFSLAIYKCRDALNDAVFNFWVSRLT